MIATIWLDCFGKIPYGQYPIGNNADRNRVNEIAESLKESTGNNEIWVEVEEK